MLDPHDQHFIGLVQDWRNLLFPTASDMTFADGYAQTLTFALLLGRTEGIDFSASTSIHDIVTGLQVDRSHALMAKALQLLTDSATGTASSGNGRLAHPCNRGSYVGANQRH